MARKLVPLGEIEQRVKRLMKRRIRPRLFIPTAENARDRILREVREKNAKGKRVTRFAYRRIRRIVNREAAEALRSLPRERPEVRRAVKITTLVRLRYGDLAQIALSLSEKHRRIVELLSTGKGIDEISRVLENSPETVKGAIMGIKFHLNYFDRTGIMPRRKTPKVKNWEKSANLVKRHFPSLKGREFQRCRRATALGLEGVLPIHFLDIYALRRVIQKSPKHFSEDLLASLGKEPKLKELVTPFMDRVKKAAERGDQVAKFMLQRSSRRSKAKLVEAIRKGGGLAARHPDLFLDTPFRPERVVDIHRESLRTRKNLVRQLAARNERVGTAMQLFLEGKSHRQIGQTMQTSREQAINLLNLGAHIVFGIQPKAIERVLTYTRIRRRYAHLFRANSRTLANAA